MKPKILDIVYEHICTTITFSQANTGLSDVRQQHYDNVPYDPELVCIVKCKMLLRSPAHTFGKSEANRLINGMPELDLKVTLADNDLPKVVKACELAGMEVAFPLLSDEMVAFSARLTPQQKLNGTQLRYFFKQALRGFLPDESITKQKHGFGLPFGVWLQHHKPLQHLIEHAGHRVTMEQWFKQRESGRR